MEWVSLAVSILVFLSSLLIFASVKLHQYSVERFTREVRQLGSWFRNGLDVRVQHDRDVGQSDADSGDWWKHPGYEPPHDRPG